MSILNGNTSGGIVYPIAHPFGNALTPISIIDQPSVALALLCDDIIICGGTKISLYRISDDGGNEFVSSLENCGKARQIAVKDGFAYITARENGVYVCDFTKPSEPKLVYNIDTIELATGIAVAGDVLAVVSRHMGCEIFDISSPERPLRIGHFMCGEAQSVCLYGKYAIVGDWMNKRARIFDISDMANINELSQMYVDGFADGVCTFRKNGRIYCAIASGHHSARLKNRRKYENFPYLTSEMLAEGYGAGHGVELYDVTNPRSPEWVSAIKAPPLFGGLDTWLTFTDGERIVFTDSMNGVFVISVEDVENPRITDYYKLPPIKNPCLTPPSVQIQTGAVTSAVSVKGFLCTASEQNGVHILKTEKPLGKFLRQSLDVKLAAKSNTNEKCFFKTAGQLHGFVRYADKIYCASGNAGIEVLDLSGRLIYTKKTEGICRDIILYDDNLICAESDKGIAVYGTNETLSEKHRIQSEGASARQILKTKSGIAVVSGLWNVAFYSEDEKNGFVLRANQRIPGILYHRHLSPLSENGDGVVANPLAVGPTVLLENDGGVDMSIVFDTQFCPFSDGACGVDGRLLAIYQGRCFVSDVPYKNPRELKIENAALDGQPFIVGKDLVLINRYTGDVEVIDISDPNAPAVTKKINLGVHPEFCAGIDGKIYVACGSDGMLEV